MAVNTLKLIHYCTDGLDAVVQLNAESLLYDTANSVAVHHGREIVETVSHCQSLRISHLLKHLLYATVNISEVRINLLYSLTVKYSLKSQHTVC